MSIKLQLTPIGERSSYKRFTHAENNRNYKKNKRCVKYNFTKCGKYVDNKSKWVLCRNMNKRKE